MEGYYGKGSALAIVPAFSIFVLYVWRRAAAGRAPAPPADTAGLLHELSGLAVVMQHAGTINHAPEKVAE
eukprot:gene26958-41376_t